MSRLCWASVVVGTAFVFGCSDDSGRADGSGGINTVSDSAGTADGGGTASGATATATAGGTDSNSGGSGADGVGNAKFDIGGVPDAAPREDEGCQKVDFLFVIDNSGSMSDDQVNLVNSFPGFITAIQSTLVNVNEYQVGVVTSDNYSGNTAGGADCTQLSGLVTQTGGANSSNSVCGPYMAGNNYMTEIDDLNTSFACAAQVGSGGSGTELVMQATEEAVQKVLGGVGQCNEGFIRDDALLVIVIITDEADGPTDPSTHSPGTPASWFNTVVNAKGGFVENAVVVSLIQWPGGPCNVTPGSVFDGTDIRDFTLMFGPNGFVGGVCEPDYSPLLQQAVGVIDNACDNFIPPG